MRLAGCGALVTGAGRRIGKQIALQLARSGAGVAVHFNTSRTDAENVVAEIRAAGGHGTAVQADLREPAAAARLFDATRSALVELGFESVQVLINNASVFVPSTLESTDPERWQEDFAVHVEAPLSLVRSFATSLPAGTQGRIINLLDWRAWIPDPDYVSYGISKATLLSMTRMLARSLGPRILVNGVAPGAVLAAAGECENPKELLKDLPVPRMGQVNDVVDAVMYLLERADYTTGAIIPVDGGRHLL